jgi:hypothetical protein
MTKRVERPKEPPYYALTSKGVRLILTITDAAIQNMAWNYIGRAAVGRRKEMPPELRENEDLADELEEMADYAIMMRDKYLGMCITNHNNRTGDNQPTTDRRPTDDRRTTDRHNHNSNNKDNENINNEHDSIHSNLNSLQSISRPNSVREVLDFSNSQKNQWNVTKDEAERWFTMNDDNGWIDYSTHEPIRNWHGLLKRWLLAERKKTYDKVWSDREARLHEKATDYGIDAELDRQWYNAIKQLAALKPSNLAVLTDDMQAYENHYHQIQDEEQPF